MTFLTTLTITQPVLCPRCGSTDFLYQRGRLECQCCQTCLEEEERERARDRVMVGWDDMNLTGWELAVWVVGVLLAALAAAWLLPVVMGWLEGRGLV